ncbi:BrnT family toxin [Methylobacterium sp. Gmos1]
MLMVWDAPKRASNIRKHRMDFADARDRFEWAGALVEAGKPAPDGRPRFLAVGFLDGQLVSLVFAPVGSEAIAAISLRRASRSERSRYDET